MSPSAANDKHEIRNLSKEIKSNFESFEKSANQTEDAIGLVGSLIDKIRSMPRESIHTMEQEKWNLEELERNLQAQKYLLDTQKRNADKNFEAMQKMEDAAIKRLAPKV